MTAADVAKYEDQMVEVMSSLRFRRMEALGGEVPFFIYPYDPRDALDVATSKKRITNKLNQRGVKILEVNLYDLTVELLKERGVWDDLLALEPTIPKDDFRDGLRSMLDPGDDLAPAIRQQLESTEFDILFLTGIGEVFPYIRAHNMLNNLQSAVVDKPMLMFFPGTYEQSQNYGSSLVLFGLLKDDQYYRATDIRKLEA